MAFYVVKKIHGDLYLYWQRSIRVSERVVSESKYIAPVSGATSERVATVIERKSIATKTRKEVRTLIESGKPQARINRQVEQALTKTHFKKTIRDQVQTVLASAEPPPAKARLVDKILYKEIGRFFQTALDKLAKTLTASNDPVNNPASPKFNRQPRTKPGPPDNAPTFTNKIKLDQYGLSAAGLKKEHDQFVKKCQSLGLDSNQFPNIKLAYGKHVGSHSATLSKTVIVTLPRGEKGNRAQFRHEYRRALARSMLDQIEQQNSTLMMKLEAQFKPSFERTNKHLYHYMKTGGVKNGKAKAIALARFGKLNPLGKKEVPVHLGVTEFGIRKDWRDEFVATYAYIKKKSSKRALREASELLAAAEENVKRAKAPRKSDKSFSVGRRINKARTKHQAQAEFVRKLEMMDRFLSSGKQ